jgi:hypothetical protein
MQERLDKSELEKEALRKKSKVINAMKLSLKAKLIPYLQLTEVGLRNDIAKLAAGGSSVDVFKQQIEFVEAQAAADVEEALEVADAAEALQREEETGRRHKQELLEAEQEKSGMLRKLLSAQEKQLEVSPILKWTYL